MGHNVRKLVFRVFDQVRLKTASSAAAMSMNIEHTCIKTDCYTLQMANNKGADQTVLMRDAQYGLCFCCLHATKVRFSLVEVNICHI